MCKCHSYNLHDPIENGDDKTRETIILRDGISIQVDACIAPIIKEMWDSGVHTLESCCGHEKGDSAGYIMLNNNATDREISVAKNVLKKYGRIIPVKSWYLITM